MALQFSISPGGIVEITFPQRVNGQRMLNFLHYRTDPTGSAVADGQAAIDALVAVLTSPNGIRGKLTALQSSAVKHDNVTSQIVWPTRRVRVVHDGTAQDGTLGLLPVLQNIQLSIVKQGPVAGKHNIGALRIGGIDHTRMVDGLWTPGMQVDFQELADLLPDVVNTGEVSWQPIIFNRSNPIASARLDRAFVGEEVRTQRTRTVGRGE